MEEARLKGDETYPQCPYCGKPIRDNQDSIGVSIPGGPGATLHSECFHKRAKEITGGIGSPTTEGRNDMVGVQTAINPETGEIIDDDMLRNMYTETSITGKQYVNERAKLGEMVSMKVLGQVVMTGEALDNDGIKHHVQKVKVVQVEEIKRGAL